MGDWIITAGILAISLVLCLAWLAMDARIRQLEKEVKDGIAKAGSPADLTKLLEEEILSLAELQKENDEKKYNPSYGDPSYTEWIDKDFDSKGVK